VVTGQPGRKFVIAGADRLAYRIHAQPIGYRVERLDGSDKPTSTLYMRAGELATHGLGKALREGCLFTPALASASASFS